LFYFVSKYVITKLLKIHTCSGVIIHEKNTKQMSEATHNEWDICMPQGKTN